MDICFPSLSDLIRGAFGYVPRHEYTFYGVFSTDQMNFLDFWPPIDHLNKGYIAFRSIKLEANYSYGDEKK